MTRPLICMPCSATKSSAPGEIPALHRYDGPMWRTLRAGLDGHGNLDVWFLSAQFGFHPVTMRIPDYERRMTASRAAELLATPASNRYAFAHAVVDASAVLFAGGRLYRDTMNRATALVRHGLPVSETAGLGIGYQRAQLAAWMRDHG